MTLYEDHVELYDIAFDWDVTDEVEWLLDRLGRPRRVLEPGCGSGRMLHAFARRGIGIVGIDNSPAMVEFARRRLAAAGSSAQVVLADMTDFDLGRSFDGGICPINTLGHLTREDLAHHLDCMARHLEPRARYLAQVAIVGGADFARPSEWEAERDGVRLRVKWEIISPERHRSRIEIVEGPRAGETLEEEHTMTPWDASSWRTAIDASPFQQVAVYDGNERERPQVDLGRGGGLLWHELVVP